MKSKLIPGYDFEYTLDGVLAPEYDEYLHKKYTYDGLYKEKHIKELVSLRDVCVTTIMCPYDEVKERFNKDLDVDGKLGIYQWYNLFRKIYVVYDTKDYLEDDVRMALDLVKKYPEHKDLVKLIDGE